MGRGHGARGKLGGGIDLYGYVVEHGPLLIRRHDPDRGGATLQQKPSDLGGAMGGVDDEDTVCLGESYWHELGIDTNASDLGGNVAAFAAHDPGKMPGVASVKCREEVVLSVWIDSCDDNFGAHCWSWRWWKRDRTKTRR